MTEATDAFASVADRYAREEMHRYVPDVVLGLADPSEDDRYLDLGAGPGTLTRLIEPHVGLPVGADPTLPMLERFRIQTRGLPVAADAHRLPFRDESFTLVTCGSVFHHLPVPTRAAAEVARVLRPGGRILVIDMAGPEDPHRRSVRDEVEAARDPSHVRTLAPSQMRGVLRRAGLELRAEERQTEDKRDVDWVGLMGGDLEYVRDMIRKHRTSAAGFLALHETPDGFVFRRERAYYLAVKRR